MGLKYNHKCPNKREAEGHLTQIGEEENVTTEKEEIEVVRPQVMMAIRSW